MNQSKIKKITDLLDQLYCFTPNQVATYMKRIPYMTEEGLTKLVKTLEAGLKEQNKMLEKWTERDPEYANKLADFATKKTKELIGEFEEAEKSSAEDILNEIK